MGEVGRAEKPLRVTINGGHVRVAIGQRPKVEGEDVLGKAFGQNIRVKDDRLNPRFDCVGAHSFLTANGREYMRILPLHSSARPL